MSKVSSSRSAAWYVRRQRLNIELAAVRAALLTEVSRAMLSLSNVGLDVDRSLGSPSKETRRAAQDWSDRSESLNDLVRNVFSTVYENSTVHARDLAECSAHILSGKFPEGLKASLRQLIAWLERADARLEEGL